MYAKETRVPIGQSQSELKKILDKYGAASFAFGEQVGSAVVMFEMASRRFKFILPMPIKHVTKTKKGYMMDQKQVDQLSRSRWRCLVLAIKAKLECVESGITTLEQEFLAHVMLPGGQTMGDVAIPQIASSYQSGSLPPLLGYGP